MALVQLILVVLGMFVGLSAQAKMFIGVYTDVSGNVLYQVGPLTDSAAACVQIGQQHFAKLKAVSSCAADLAYKWPSYTVPSGNNNTEAGGSCFYTTNTCDNPANGLAYQGDGRLGVREVADNTDNCSALTGKPATDLLCGGGRTCVINGNLDTPSLCQTPCLIVGQREMSAIGADGKWYTWASGFKYTGTTCLPSDSTPSTSPTVPSTSTSTGVTAQQPPPGKCPGQVNGADVWVPCSWSTETKATTSTSSVTTGTSSNTGSTPVTSKQVDMGCDDAGQCTKTTTVTVSVGGQQSTTVSVDKGGKDALCKGESLTQCGTSGGGTGSGSGGDGSSFGGSCTSEPSCSGDAATCAIARATWVSRCALQTDSSDPTVLVGNNAMTGEDPADHPRKNAAVVEVGSFNATNPWSSSCPSDYSLSMGPLGTVAVPLSSACSVLTMMGQLLVGLTLLVSAMWVVKGV